MATVVLRPPERPPAAPPEPVPPARARAEHVADEIRQPGWGEGLALFAISAAVFFWIGYKTVIDDGVVVFDALDRLTRAYLVWHNDPPKLAAIGFVFPPLTTLTFLPFTIAKPLATSLVALPLTSAIFGGAMVSAMNRLLARCSMARAQRWLVLALLAGNPLVLFYAGNGMSEVVYLALLTFTLYCIASWFLTTQPRFLVAAAMTFALLLLLRYSFGVLAIVVALMMAVGLIRRGASNDETEGTLVTFLAPLVYALGVWMLFNWLIVGDPLSWLTSSGAFAVNAPQGRAPAAVAVSDVVARLGQLTLGVCALAIVVVPALIAAAVAKRDELSLWLAVLALGGLLLIGASALIGQDLDALALRNALPVLIVCVAGGAWLYRILPGLRPVIWIGLLVGLALTAIGSWTAMKRYPFQSQEQAFVRAIESGDSQEGTNSIGGFRVGTRPEAQMARFVDANVGGRSAILADNAQTFGVIVLSGRPQLFFDRVDKGDGVFRQLVRQPYGKVSHLLMAKQVSGDLIRLRYPSAASRVAAGLTPELETERYLLLRVPARDPRRARDTTASSGGAAAGIGGRARGSDGTPAGGARP